jgi:hypothetical protein
LGACYFSQIVTRLPLKFDILHQSNETFKSYNIKHQGWISQAHVTVFKALGEGFWLPTANAEHTQVLLQNRLGKHLP